MNGFLRRLRGFLAPSEGTEAPQKGAASEPEIYKDYVIQPEPISEGGQYRLAARILSQTGEERREFRFIRADVFSSREDADRAAVRKAQRLIDEQGERLFD